MSNAISQRRGRFITFEGVEGVGKSTNIAFLGQFLEGQDVDYLVTREPGGTPVAEEIRQLLLSDRDEILDDTTDCS